METFGWLFIGLTGMMVGGVEPIQGRGYILGKEMNGWTVRLPALFFFLLGLAMVVFGGILGIL